MARTLLSSSSDSDSSSSEDAEPGVAAEAAELPETPAEATEAAADLFASDSEPEVSEVLQQDEQVEVAWKLPDSDSDVDGAESEQCDEESSQASHSASDDPFHIVEYLQKSIRIID